jgi:hypothetical protein
MWMRILRAFCINKKENQFYGLLRMVYNTQNYCFWTLLIVRYTKEHVSDTGYVYVVRRES